MAGQRAPQVDGLRREIVRTPDEVAAMLRLWELGWRTWRIAAEFGCSRNTVTQKLVSRIGQASALPFPIHPHMLRHACGFKLANDGVDTRALQEWLGHSNIQHTTRYTELTPKRFKSFFADEE